MRSQIATYLTQDTLSWSVSIYTQALASTKFICENNGGWMKKSVLFTYNRFQQPLKL